jgi:hypothetical protein|tara:strand:- start:524 stop:685 length:162 start_codon:yes stop_codon:yes gene_type:complete
MLFDIGGNPMTVSLGWGKRGNRRRMSDRASRGVKKHVNVSDRHCGIVQAEVIS